MSVTANSQQRPRSKSTFSFASNKSDKSRKSEGLTAKLPKIDLKETKEEKHRSKFNAKSDPSKAISEDEPFAVSQSHPNDIRALPHKDQFGNLIVEPDRSNPTRPRWERPLDTIRSFEAAIDNEYKRKSYYGRPDLNDNANGGYSRRSSYYAPNSYNARGHQDGGYYGNRGGITRQESNFTDNHSPANPYSQNRPRFSQRVNTEPPLNTYTNGQSVYPSNAYQQSVDTVNTASGGSYSTDPWGYSTDPSSEDSLPAPKMETSENYNNYGVHLGNAGQTPIASSLNYPGYSQGAGSYGPSNGSTGVGYYQQGPPDVPPHLPPKDNIRPMEPMSKLSGPPVSGGRPAPAEKRKSWFKRFSKSN